MALKFYTSVEKWSKLKARKFLGPIPTFLDVTGEKLVGGIFFERSHNTRLKKFESSIIKIMCIVKSQFQKKLKF